MDKLTLIKVGGKIVEEQETLSRLLVAFAAIPEKKVLVHGGGRSATAMASRLGIESRMVGGRRITDKSMLEVVTMVYGGLVNKSIVAGLQAVGVNALGMTGADMNILLSDKRPAGEVDYGYVGDVRHADGKALTGLIEMGVVPVIAPLTHDGKGSMLNTNADTMAGETEDIDLNAIDIPQEGESYCYPQIGHLYFVHQAWKSSSRIQNHCGYFLVIESLRNQDVIIILSSEYTPSGWEWIDRY